MALKWGRVMVAVLLGGASWAAHAHGLQAMPRLVLRSASVLVQDQGTGEPLVEKRTDDVLPIASITKLMTAMVLLDAHLDMHESITIQEEDKDTLRHSRSRLPVGTTLTREEALLLALMSSENRAAHALGRTYPAGLPAFVAAMNAKAAANGFTSTHYQDPAGLSSGNVSSARDLARIVDLAHHYEEIRACTTTEEATIQGRRGPIAFHNTNRLLLNPHWRIGLSKTGFIDESGQCLVMQAELKQRPVLIVLLDSTGKGSRFGDADRIRQWMEGTDPVVQVRAKVRRRVVAPPVIRRRHRRVQVASVRVKHKHAVPVA